MRRAPPAASRPGMQTGRRPARVSRRDQARRQGGVRGRSRVHRPWPGPSGSAWVWAAQSRRPPARAPRQRRGLRSKSLRPFEPRQFPERQSSCPGNRAAALETGVNSARMTREHGETCRRRLWSVRDSELGQAKISITAACMHVRPHPHRALLRRQSNASTESFPRGAHTPCAA